MRKPLSTFRKSRIPLFKSFSTQILSNDIGWGEQVATSIQLKLNYCKNFFYYVPFFFEELMTTMKMQKLSTLLAIAMVAMAVTSANAADITWDNDLGDNNWFAGANWDPDVPGWNSSDNATVLSGTPTATSNVNIDGGGSLLIDGGDVFHSGRFNSIGNTNGGTLILNSGSFNVDYAGGSSHNFSVGISGPGLVQQSGGTFNVINAQADEMNIGRSAGSVGLYELSGGTLNAGRINVSRDNGSLGTLEMSGGTLNAEELYIGRDGSANGVVEISGGTVNVGVIVNGSGGTSTLHIIGDDATITSSATGPSIAGFSMFNNFKSTLKLTIDEGISLIDASAGTVGISAPASDGRAPTLDVEFSVTPQLGDVFDIIKYGTLQSGRWDTFDGLADSPLGQDTIQLAIDYEGGALGDTIQLRVVPEPSTMAMVAVAVVAAGMFSRRLSL